MRLNRLLGVPLSRGARRAESQPGEGATFYLEIPAAVEAAPARTITHE